MIGSALSWLEPSTTAGVAAIRTADRKLVERLDEALARLLGGDADEAASFVPLDTKRLLAAAGFGGVDTPVALGGAGRPGSVQLCLQFVCGYHDLDLRDAAHVGHGRLVLRHGSAKQLERWRSEILDGALVGLAATERDRGTTIQAIETVARRERGRLVLRGKKSWISRIEEASLFVVFFKAEDDERLSAALVDARAPGLRRRRIEPAGLRGWSWGELTFDGVELADGDLLGALGDGIDLFREHFTYYRPLVAATALGAAASIYDLVIRAVRQKLEKQTIERCRDSALETFGRTFIELQGALAAVRMAGELCGTEDEHRSWVWSRLAKAHGVDVAHRVVGELSRLGGAFAFQASAKIAKVQRDLQGLLYADGIHDALLRSAGRALVGDRGAPKPPAATVKGSLPRA